MNKTQDIKVNEKDIIASLKPLIDEYFSGKTDVENNKIIYSAENGQAFQIAVTQI